jgi:ATP-binding cassette, subfamily C, bacterial LapB
MNAPLDLSLPSRALCRVAAIQGLVLNEADVLARLVERQAGGEGVVDALIALWRSLVPGARVLRTTVGQLAREDYPALLDLETGWQVIRRKDGSEWVVEPLAGEAAAKPTADLPALVLRVPAEARARGEAGRAAERASVSWFWREIRRYMPTFAEVSIASLAANLLALAASLFAMQVYDRVVPNLAYQTLWVLAAGVGLAILFEMLIRAARAQLLDHACKRIDINLSDGLFRHLVSIRMNARPQALGTLAAQVRDFETVRNFLTSTTLFAIADAPFVVLFLFVIWLVGGSVVIIPILAVIVTILVGLAAQWPLRRLSNLHVKESNERNGLLIEAIDGAEMIKATGSEWQMARQWNALTEQLSADGLRMRGISNLMVGSASAIQQVAYAGMVVQGVYLIGDGRMTMGALIACSILSGRVLSPIVQVVSLAFQWNYARVALKTLDGLMALPTDGPPAGQRPVVKDRFEARLAADGVTFQYAPAGPAVLTVPQLQFVPGERVAILGPTGSGKSTLLKVLAGIYAPTQGRVLLDGIDLSQVDPAQVRRHVGYLPQHVRLFQGTLRENLTLGLVPPSDEEILAAARITGVDRLIRQHPQGLSLPLSEGGYGLSGGQSQAVGLARALLGHPDLILLDEPTASMDQALETETVRHILASLRPGQTLVCVTHKPVVLQAMDRLVVIDRGRIVLDGPRGEVLRRLGAPQVAGGQ